MPPWDTIIRTTKEGQEVRGTFLSAFIKNGDTYYLSDIQIFADGAIYCWEWVDFEGFKKKVASGWVRTTLPEDAPVSIYPLAQFQARDVASFVREQEFVKAVADEIERLNGRPTTLDVCFDAYQRWRAEKTDDAREALKVAYEAVPDYQRVLVLGDMDRRDLPIRKVIYGLTEDEDDLLEYAEDEEDE
jgi:hypothetical protein